MSRIVCVADAVVAELNATTFSRPFEARRCYLPRLDLAEMAGLYVTVVPKEVTVIQASRSSNRYDCTVDVALQKKLDATDNAQIDPLMGLVDELAGHFENKRLDSYPGAVWTKTEHGAIYAPEHLDDLRQFTSLLTFTFSMCE